MFVTLDYRELPSNQAAELRGAGPGLEVQILPHDAGEGECVALSDAARVCMGTYMPFSPLPHFRP